MFFLIFKHVLFTIINLKNIQSNFKTIGFILYNLKIIIDNLDIKSYTCTSSNSCLMNFTFKLPKHALHNKKCYTKFC